MARKTEVLMDNLTFAEGPRWRDNRLYFSDFYDHQVWSLDTDGNAERIVQVPQQPSGLGWLPDGSMLVVSMLDRKLMRFADGRLEEVADCSKLAPSHCNDMVVNTNGDAYIGNFGFVPDSGDEPTSTCMILVRPGEEPCIAADDLMFPNGTVITPDGRTLIVGETWGQRFTAFDIEADGSLSNRRTWADLKNMKPDYNPMPDGSCLDETGAVWTASFSTQEVIRIGEGGELLDSIPVSTNPYACMLGGEDRRTLFICTASSYIPDQCSRNRDGKIETIRVEHPGAGLP